MARLRLPWGGKRREECLPALVAPSLLQPGSGAGGASHLALAVLGSSKGTSRSDAALALAVRGSSSSQGNEVLHYYSIFILFFSPLRKAFIMVNVNAGLAYHQNDTTATCTSKPGVYCQARLLKMSVNIMSLHAITGTRYLFCWSLLYKSQLLGFGF